MYTVAGRIAVVGSAGMRTGIMLVRSAVAGRIAMNVASGILARITMIATTGTLTVVALMLSATVVLPIIGRLATLAL